MAQHYATIGTDGTRPVIWGLGASPEASEADAREQYCDQHMDLGFNEEGMLTIPITEEQAQRVSEDEEISTEVLGIELPKAWLAEHQGK